MFQNYEAISKSKEIISKIRSNYSDMELIKECVREIFTLLMTIKTPSITCPEKNEILNNLKRFALDNASVAKIIADIEKEFNFPFD